MKETRLKFEYNYWKFFNKLAKVVGYAFALVGCFGLLMQAIIKLDPELITSLNSQAEATIPSELEPLFFIVYSFVLVVGILMIKVKPYFPKHLLDYKEEPGGQVY